MMRFHISIQHHRWKFEPRSDDFLIRFSLAMDFAPYLPGRTRVEAWKPSVLTPVQGSWRCLGAPSGSHTIVCFGQEGGEASWPNFTASMQGMRALVMPLKPRFQGREKTHVCWHSTPLDLRTSGSNSGPNLASQVLFRDRKVRNSKAIALAVEAACAALEEPGECRGTVFVTSTSTNWSRTTRVAWPCCHLHFIVLPVSAGDNKCAFARADPGRPTSTPYLVTACADSLPAELVAIALSDAVMCSTPNVKERPKCLEGFGSRRSSGG